MTTLLLPQSPRAMLHADLLVRANGLQNAVYLSQMLITWREGGGALPAYMGLSAAQFTDLLLAHFPGIEITDWLSDRPALDLSRMPEFDDLVEFLERGRARRSGAEPLLARIVAAACMGLDHLWQDLGVWSRTELSALLHFNFPGVASANTRDMKWKKFLYKQLCEQTGVYVCRSPSCDVCVDYANCFGPEA